MAIIKCKMCGGDIVLNEEKTIGTCEYCGTQMTLPKVSDEQRAALFNRGNHFRRQGEFDKALAVYENIVREDDADAEAHWCCALCRFGIEYVEDPNTYEYIPTCHRASFDSFLEDVDYKAAIENSDGITRRQYQKDAAKIAEVQRGILATSQNEEPFDVFICYKETDDATKERTRDSLDAQEIYYQLTQEGYRVFFSRITLEDKAGTEYEPYIFAALNSAKVMVAIGSKPEYFNAVWVKNEWSRFLAMMRKDRSKLLLPCYKGMDPYDLPEQLGILQSYDMAKIGFMQDLIRGIKKVLSKDEAKQTETIKETVVVNSGSANVAPLLKRAFMFLEDGNWKEADEYCEKVLDQEPENAQAYLGKLMAELHVRRQEDLPNCEQPFNTSNNYQKAVRFGDDKIAGMLAEYNDHGIYNDAVTAMKSARSESSYKAAAAKFKTIPGFKDADSLAEQCFEKAEQMKKQRFEKAEQMKKQRFEKAEQMKKRVMALVRALKEVGKTKAGPTLEEKLSSEKTKINDLIRIQGTFVSTQTKIRALQSELNGVDSQEKQLSEQRSRLGIFAGKEKRRIDEELTGLSKKKSSLTTQISQLLDGLGGYTALADVERDLNEAKNSAADLEAQIESARANADYDYSFEEACNIYLREADMAAEIDKIYPALRNIDAMRGKSDTIWFGRYVQEKNGSPEAIEWRVLARENGRMLVISKYGLDCQPYNTSNTSVTWGTCSLRKWLNGTFLNSAFSENERAMIPSVAVSADRNPKYKTHPGRSTTDQVFLLSITEANKYFSSDSARQCQGTAYGYAQGVYKDPDGNCWWWLRSPGCGFNLAASVGRGGSVSNHGCGVYIGDYAVRPALWIDLGS